MKHSFYASALALTLGLSGCSTLEGVWADIKTAKPFKSTQSDDNVQEARDVDLAALSDDCLLYTSPSPRDKRQSRMPSSA